MIGLLGGTFDPIHLGHLRPALDCLQALGLDQVRLIPLNVAVHRPQPIANGATRLRMLWTAIAGEPGLVADPRELERPGGSYTYETLMALREELGHRVPLCLLVGSDAFASFLDWYRPLDILGLAHLVVMQRPEPGPALPPELERLYREHQCSGRADLAAAPAGRMLNQGVTQMAISATRVRELIRTGTSPRYLVPDAVLEIIRQEGLYR